MVFGLDIAGGEKTYTQYFQFPVGIRWCSDEEEKAIQDGKWELSIPCGN